MKFYERLRPLRVQNDALNQRIELITSDLKDREQELAEERQVN